MSEHPPSGLRDRVQHLRPENGHLVHAGNLWARVTATGHRVVDAGTMTHTVTVRFRVGVAPGDRFLHRGRALEVITAEDLTGRRMFTACRCNDVTTKARALSDRSGDTGGGE